jgi:hypothetical protein
MSSMKAAGNETRDYEAMSRGYAFSQTLIHRETDAEYNARLTLTQDAGAFPEVHEPVTGYLDAFNGTCTCGHVLTSEATYRMRGAKGRWRGITATTMARRDAIRAGGLGT